MNEGVAEKAEQQMTEEGIPPQTGIDSSSKVQSHGLSPQWIATFGVLGAAIISAIVSYGVAAIQATAQKERSLLEARLEEARIFQELLERIPKWNDPSFVVLALSKVFPDDEELIVTTAMMNPNIHTASTLNAIGADENLDQYLDTIKGMVVNASADRRRAFNDIYRDKFPEFVMDVNYEVAVRSDGDDAAIGDLISSMTIHPALVPTLRSRIESDARVGENIRLKARLARMLYQVDPSHMAALLSAAAEDGETVEVLARQYANHVDSLRPDVRDKLAETALTYLEANVGERGVQENTSDVMHLIDRLGPDRHLSQEQRERLAELTESFFREFARLGRPSTSSLLTLHAFTQDTTARRLYFETVACLNLKDAEAFYRAFPTRELGLEDWDDTEPFEEARSQARSRLKGEDEQCAAW